MKIISASILEGFGCDKILLHTDLPEAVYPYDTKLALSFEAAAGRGLMYVNHNWPNLPCEVIVRKSNRPKFGKCGGRQ